MYFLYFVNHISLAEWEGRDQYCWHRASRPERAREWRVAGTSSGQQPPMARACLLHSPIATITFTFLTFLLFTFAFYLIQTSKRRFGAVYLLESMSVSTFHKYFHFLFFYPFYFYFLYTWCLKEVQAKKNSPTVESGFLEGIDEYIHPPKFQK